MRLVRRRRGHDGVARAWAGRAERAHAASDRSRAWSPARCGVQGSRSERRRSAARWRSSSAARPIGGDVPAPSAAGARASTPADRRCAARPAGAAGARRCINTRFQPCGPTAGLTAADVPRLTAEVGASGFPMRRWRGRSRRWRAGACSSAARTAPSTRSTRRPAASTGRSAPRGGVRTAITSRMAWRRTPRASTSATRPRNVYALDADTGRQCGREASTITRSRASPGRRRCTTAALYVPISSYEEVAGRRSAVRLLHVPRQRRARSMPAPDAVVWKTLHDSRRAAAPRDEHAPACRCGDRRDRPIWSAPTVDARRRALYVATGNTYSGPPQPSSDAVVALDLETGAMRGCGRSRQATSTSPTAAPATRTVPTSPAPTSTSAARRCWRDARRPGPAGRSDRSPGSAFAMDPDTQGGEVVWQYRAGRAACSAASSGARRSTAEHAYFAVSDITSPARRTARGALRRGARAWTTRTSVPVRWPAPPAPKWRRRPRLQRGAIGGGDGDSRRRVLGVE